MKFIPYCPTNKKQQWFSLRWRHNDHDCVSNHQPRGCLLNHLFRRRSKKTSKLRVTGLCVGNSPGPVNSPHKGPVTRKMFPFDDVIMSWWREPDKPQSQPVMAKFTVACISVTQWVEWTLHWRHNGRDIVSNHQPYDCLLNRSFRNRWKKTLKSRVAGLCAGNSPVMVNSLQNDIRNKVSFLRLHILVIQMLPVVNSQYKWLKQPRTSYFKHK